MSSAEILWWMSSVSDDGDEDTRSCNGGLFVVGIKIQGSSLGDAMGRNGRSSHDHAFGTVWSNHCAGGQICRVRLLLWHRAEDTLLSIPCPLRPILKLLHGWWDAPAPLISRHVIMSHMFFTFHQSTDSNTWEITHKEDASPAPHIILWYDYRNVWVSFAAICQSGEKNRQPKYYWPSRVQMHSSGASASLPLSPPSSIPSAVKGAPSLLEAFFLPLES